MRIKESTTKTLLKYLAIGSGVAVCSLLAPTLPYVLVRTYLRQKKFQKGLFLRDLKRLQKRKLLKYQECKDGSVKITLEKEGRKYALQYRFKDLTIQQPHIWDGKWRLVLFDIPTAKNKARDALRRKIQELGFYQLQRSVFIYPYPCEKEIEFIGSVFDVRDYIIILSLNRFEGEEKLKQHFQLSQS